MLLIVSAGRVPAQSLHPPVSATQDPFVHVLSADSVGHYVLLRLLAVGLRQDGLSDHHSAPSSGQVRNELPLIVQLVVRVTLWPACSTIHLTSFRRRHKIVAYIIDARYLEALDGEHQ